MARFALLLNLLVTLGFAVAQMPAHAEIAIAPVIGKEASTEFVATTPSVRYAFTITNTGDAQVSVKIKPVGVFRSSLAPCNARKVGDGCDLNWKVGSATIVEAGTAFALDRGHSLILTVEGTVPSIDSYQVLAVVDQITGTRKESTTLNLRITRKKGDLGATAITAVSGSRFDTGASGRIPLVLTNNGTATITISAAPAARLTRDEGGGKYTIPLTDSSAGCVAPPPPAGTPTTGTVGPLIPPTGLVLAPGDRLKCDLTVSDPGPGRYRADITLEQSGLIPPLATAEFSYRRPWCIAALCLLIGSIIGAVFTLWQNDLRTRLTQQADTLELRDAYGKFSATLSPKQPRTAQLVRSSVDVLDEVLATLHRRDAPDQTAALNRLRDRMPLIRRFASLETGYTAGADPDVDAACLKAFQAFGPTQSVADIDGAISAFEEALAIPKPPVEHTMLRERAEARNLVVRMSDAAQAISLRHKILFVQIFFAAISLVLSVLIGVGALWEPNPAWGGFFDIVIATLTGIAATATGTLTLSSIASPYTVQLGKGA